MTRVSTDDYAAVRDHLGRYCQLVDLGDAEAWARLWTEDAVFTGAGPEPLVGREALKNVARHVVATKMRHLYGNLACDYVGPDVIRARYLNYISTWADGPSMMAMIESVLTLVRDGDGWLIQRNDSVAVG